MYKAPWFIFSGYNILVTKTISHKLIVISYTLADLAIIFALQK
jgi:hypothetical protein